MLNIEQRSSRLIGRGRHVTWCACARSRDISDGVWSHDRLPVHWHSVWA